MTFGAIYIPNYKVLIMVKPNSSVLSIWKSKLVCVTVHFLRVCPEAVQEESVTLG